MTKEVYLNIRNDHSKDTMPVFYFWYLLNGGDNSLSFLKFNEVFSIWVFMMLPRGSMAKIQTYVFDRLDKHFKIT